MTSVRNTVIVYFQTQPHFSIDEVYYVGVGSEVIADVAVCETEPDVCNQYITDQLAERGTVESRRFSAPEFRKPCTATSLQTEYAAAEHDYAVEHDYLRL